MSSAAKVGIFMVVVLGILGFFIIRVEDISFGGEEQKTIDVVFDSVAGLDEKSTVRVAGVRVGKVAKIELLPDGRAKVRLEVDESTPIHAGATARVANLGLLGEKYVELDPGSVSQPALSGEVTLQGSSTADFDRVTEQVSDIATDLKAITASLRNAMGGPEGTRRVEEIVENVHDVTLRLRMILANNEANVNATADNLRRITDDLRVEIPRIAASIDRVAGSIGGTVGENREDVRVIVENLRTLSADLKTTTENLNNITAKVRSGEGTVGKLLYSDEAHDSLTSTLGSIEGGVGELRDVLGRVNRIGLRLGIDGYMLSDTPNAPFEGNSRLGLTAQVIPNTERNLFLHLGATQDSRGDRREKVVHTTTIVDGVESTVITKETRWDRDLLISAQFGWEFDEWMVRGGLIDSYGGLGVDYRHSPRLHFSSEIFDFGSTETDLPQLRLLGRWRLMEERKNAPAIFFNTGIEDALNQPALIFGAGVSWTDEDLKYLLGSIPMP
ncbi:MAG TPA: MlaD family protein [Thermoanaerobaculia bacterium]|nr:MlaD family protein [Thermoanaerobaculia bacterium]